MVELICPICKRDNRCGAKNTDEPCWCTRYTFPEIDKESLSLPNICICESCAQQLGAINKIPTK